MSRIPEIPRTEWLLRKLNLRPIVKISVRQVLDLANLTVKIGPISCKEWNTLLLEYFKMVSDVSCHVRAHFKDPYAMLAVRPDFSSANPDLVAKQSIGLQFMGRFASFFSEKLSCDHEKANLYTLIFTTLCRLSYDIRQRQAQGLPYADLIKAANQDLSQFSQKLSFKYKVQN